jgi:hypothetical protein
MDGFSMNNQNYNLNQNSNYLNNNNGSISQLMSLYQKQIQRLVGSHPVTPQGVQ